MKESDAFEDMIKSSLQERADHVELPQGLKNRILQEAARKKQEGINEKYKKGYGGFVAMVKEVRYSLGYKRIVATVLGLTLMLSLVLSEQARVWAMEGIEKVWVAVRAENGQYSLKQVPGNEAPGYDERVKSTSSVAVVGQSAPEEQFEKELGVSMPDTLPGGWQLAYRSLSRADGADDIEKLLNLRYKRGDQFIIVSVTRDPWWKNTDFRFNEENKVEDVKIGHIQGAWYKLAGPRYGITETDQGWGNTEEPVGIDIVQGLCWEDQGLYFMIWEYFDEKSPGSLLPEQAAKMAEPMLINR